MTGATKRIGTIGLTLVLALVLSGCASWTVTETTGWDPNSQLEHDWSPGVPMEIGQVNSCVERASEVADRAHVCRVVDGYEPVQNLNWIIDFADNAESHPLSVAHEYGYSNNINPGLDCAPGSPLIPNYGCTIQLDGQNGTYQGCVYQWQGNVYVCDYRTRKHVVLHTSSGGWSFALRKLWDWGGYLGNVLGCAGGIVGVLGFGKAVTLPLLTDCADGPM
jgi:hypothetical protein